MQLTDQQLLRRLGSGESIHVACQAAGLTRPEFDTWWQKQIRARVPVTTGRRRGRVQAAVRIHRDRWGIPHILADNDADLFFGFGYAMAQDRLFQLDYLRRRGLGRLAEVLGPSALELDTIARTVGLNRIASAEWERLSPEVRHTLEAFAAGINALMEDSADNLPIEFELLDYRPHPWTPVDSLAIESEFRWYLTGRFPVICIPELARRSLGEGSLLHDFLLPENDEEPILHPGEYRPRGEAREGLPHEPIGRAVNDPDGAIGSNNWVVSGRRTATGQPLLASDPHIAFAAVSCWYEAHLCGGSFHVCGMTYAGMPAIMFGRNLHVAWGITNNICSLRDLYQERMDPAHPDCFLFDGRPERARQLSERIEVRGASPVTKTIRFSRNGPLVDELLPPPANRTGPVSLKWLGAHQGGWLTALLAMDRAASLEEFREAVRPWHVPTFSLVVADFTGRIGYQSAGRIPIRNLPERGYRPGWDPAHQWQGLIPFESMPRVVDPPRGWVATANNRVAADDFPYRLFGCWASGWRATRIRRMIESNPQVSRAELCEMQLDAVSLRAADLVPHLVELLRPRCHGPLGRAVERLAAWDFQCLPDSVAASLFNVFYTHWCQAVAAERFEPEAVELLSKGAEACAGRLIHGDPQGWFAPGTREERVVDAFRAAIADLTNRFGPELESWTWGRLHRMPLQHILSDRGDLGQLLDHGGVPVRGDMLTVCNTGSGPDWLANTGAGYRLVADLSSSPPALLAVDGQSQSGHPGSPHYSDQLDDWLAGRYHELVLDRQRTIATATETLELFPQPQP